jgi:hypothetical protein
MSSRLGPYFNSEQPNADAIILDKELSLQVGYWPVDLREGSFNITNCQTWILPSQVAGFTLCLRPSRLNSQHLYAGMAKLWKMDLTDSNSGVRDWNGGDLCDRQLVAAECSDVHDNGILLSQRLYNVQSRYRFASCSFERG